MNFARSTKVNDQTIALAYCISDIARYYRTCLDREMAAHGLTRSQWWLLANLQYNDGANQQELAELMEMGKSAVGKLIDQLEKKGWVKRKPSATDKRAHEIWLTPRVQPLIKDIDDQAHTLIESSLADLSDHQRKQLLKQLDGVKQRLVEIRD